MTTLTELKALLELAKDYPNANVNITVTVSSGSSTPPPGGTKTYKVETGDKPNNQVKVRREADMTVSQIGFVYDGDFVTGDGRTVGVFTHILTPIEGFVESQYLIAQ